MRPLRHLFCLMVLAPALAITLTAVPALCLAEIAIDTRITIKPGNADEAADRLVKQAQQLNGYFVIKSSERVELKIPAQAATQMQQFLEINWLVYQQDYQANDITRQLIEAQSRLKAKESLLHEYENILASAQSNKLLKASSAVTKLVQDIELLRGRINVLKHRTRYAKFTILFQLDSSTADTRNVTSSFPWLNSVGLPDLLTDFSQ